MKIIVTLEICVGRETDQDQKYKKQLPHHRDLFPFIPDERTADTMFPQNRNATIHPLMQMQPHIEVVPSQSLSLTNETQKPFTEGRPCP